MGNREANCYLAKPFTFNCLRAVTKRRRWDKLTAWARLNPHSA